MEIISLTAIASFKLGEKDSSTSHSSRPGGETQNLLLSSESSAQAVVRQLQFNEWHLPECLAASAAESMNGLFHSRKMFYAIEEFVKKSERS